MPREAQNADVDPRATPVVIAAGGGGPFDDRAGWDLVQYDWGTRQGEPSRSPCRLATCIAAMYTRVGRLFIRASGAADAK